ncbi:MAG: molybdopterin converting factor [Archaeoglobales archaeon]|nr:MAG: molybdopterin converting factor [Archaeoglobales archaeon]
MAKKKAKKKAKRKTIEVLWLNNDGGGYAEKLRVPVGTTVEQLRRKRMPDSYAHDHTIRVNRDIAAASQRLRSGDSISVTPKNVAGSR